MELNGQEKKGNTDRSTNRSGKEEAGASLGDTGRDKNFGYGNSGQAGQNPRVTEKEYSFGAEKQVSSETGNSRERGSRNQNKDYTSRDSKGSFFSSLNFSKSTILGLVGALAGGALLFRATKKKKKRSSSKKAKEIRLNTEQTIKGSKEELYAYWRNLENLPNFMSHIKRIKEIDEKRSRWTAEVPGGLGTIEWEAVIEQDLRNKYISWRSVADSDIENSGEVRFETAPAGKGTIVETTISYRPPAGNAGEFAAKLLNPAFEKIVKKDLKQFKKHMEKGGRMRSGAGDLLY